MTVSGLIHAGLLVENTARALGFYHDVLGLAVDDSRPDLGYSGAWLWTGRQQIHLMELPNPDPSEGRPNHGGRDRHLALAISDIAALKQALETADVAYTMSKSGRKALFCRDPDGNALEFVELD